MVKVFLFLIIAGSAALRFWRGPDLFFWHVDEDIIALTVKRILIEHRPQLIGFPIPGGIYLGPLFYYLISIPYFLVGMNPTKLYVFSAILGTFATFLTYKVGKIIFEREIIGILAAIIFGFSYLSNVYGKVMTGLTFTPILSLLIYLILYQIIKQKKPKYFLWLGVILLTAAQNEGSSLSLIVLAIVIFAIYRIRVPIKKLILVVGMFIAFHLPLLIFDLRHNFFLTNSFLNFIKGNTLGNQSTLNIFTAFDGIEIFPRTFARFLMPSGPNDVSAQILPCHDLAIARLSSISPSMFILAIAIIGFFIISQIFKKKRVPGERIILIHFAVMVFGIIVYNLFLVGYSYEWITVIFFPGFAFLVSYFLSEIFWKKITGKMLVLSLMVFFMIVNTKAVFNSSDPFSLYKKSAAVKFALSQVSGREFYLESLGGCFNQGYLYLFWYFGQLPISAEGLIFDPAFFESGEKPDLGVVLVHDLKNTDDSFAKYTNYLSQTISRKKLGGIEVLIVDAGKSLE